MTLAGAQVAQARRLLGWSAIELGRKTGLTPKSIEGFETGKRRLSTLERVNVRRILVEASVEFAEDGAVRLRE
jgi:hypothetical protein